jgi:transcriptional regulator with XRE-family HTH domain
VVLLQVVTTLPFHDKVASHRHAPPNPPMTALSSADLLRLALGRRLRQLRALDGRTQEQLAAALGIALKNYQRLESGRHNPTLDTLGRIAAVLQVHIAQLFGPEDNALPHVRHPLPRGWRWIELEPNGGSLPGLEVWATQATAAASSQTQSARLLGLARQGRRRHPAGQFLLHANGHLAPPGTAAGDWFLLQRPAPAPRLATLVLVEHPGESEAGLWSLNRIALIEVLPNGDLRVRLDPIASGPQPLWREGRDGRELGLVAEVIAVLGTSGTSQRPELQAPQPAQVPERPQSIKSL